MLDFCTSMVYEQELLYGNGVGGHPAFSEEQIKETKKEKYADLLETFLDDVFGHESKLKREIWQGKVAKVVYWVFDPKTVRDKLEYNL